MTDFRPEFQTLTPNGVPLNVALAGPEDGPLVLFVHGFPESWYSWRHQMAALAAIGYRVAAPDVRGYGGSGRPPAVADYSMQAITADLAGLARMLSPEAPAVIVGHDWGAPLAWNTARLYPDTIRAVAGLSVVYTPPGDTVFIDLARRLFTDKGRFFYQVYFQDEGVAEAELEADVEDSLARILYAWSGDGAPTGWPTDKRHGDALLPGLKRPEMPLPWLTRADLATYVAQFSASGFRGPINRYRNWHRDHAFLSAHPSDPVIGQPSLYIAGTDDVVLSMLRRPPAEVLPEVLSDLRGVHMLPGIGHWTQQEAPEAVSRHLAQWLATL